MPRPRPPAKIWDLMTTSESPIWEAAAMASSTVWAAMPKGTLMPQDFIMAADWYSCRFRCRIVVRVGRAWRRGVRAFDRWRNSMVDGCIRFVDWVDCLGC